jgi:UDP-N-acetylglucosamine--N-acetylmuramyl-(pentapeptide) pyrophosphoryl-undecaprenol N-acetylglucosamine transferase
VERGARRPNPLDSGVPRSIVIAAGGTGGHIFPGLALADAIRRRDPGMTVSFVGTPRGLERSIIPKRGYALELIDMKPFVRRIALGPLWSIVSLVRATRQAGRIIRLKRPATVVGMGGYVSLPVLAAARWRRVPSLLHESGAVPGLSNRVAARLTPNVALAFEEAAKRFPGSVRPRTVGMPLEPSVAGLNRSSLRSEARAALDLPSDDLVLLVLGGSLGARRLNDVGVALASRWRDRRGLRILLKTGAEHLQAVQAELEQRGVSHLVRCMAFLDRMDLAYASADMALCRAGAGTVAELAAAGLPSILVPYPHAPGDHQTANARPLVSAGGAILVPDLEADAARIGTIADELLGDEERRIRMSAGARSLSRPNAADDLAAWVLELAGATRA